MSERRVSARPRVVVFAKRPVLGKVKSRLAADIGADGALAFYRTTLAETLDRLSGRAGWTTEVAVTPDDAVADPLFDRVGWGRIPQGAGDLGVRMSAALANANPAQPVIIVGSDVPDLTADHVAQAIDALAGDDLVIGPSPDGGFWLIGARRAPAGLLAAVRWSTAHALADVLANASGWSVARLENLEDVDDGSSHARHLAKL